MDVVQIFNDELQSLLDTKPPVSKAKMGLITRAAMKGVKFYKHIVQSVEKFILKCRPEYKVPGLYVIDSIVRQSRHQFGIERDVYAARFSRNLKITFSNLFSGCLADDKPKIVRVLNLWQKNGVFDSQIIQPLLDMANPGSALPIDPNSLSAASPSGSMDNSSSSKQGQSSNFLRNHFNSSSNSGNVPGRHQKTAEGGLKFSKNMLDFDYDEDDDDDGDETPTEAEPPLSSTLNKIEMEQRGQRNELTSNNLAHQSSQMHSMQHSDQQQQQSMTNQDPVLERWNRLIRQQSITNESSNDRPSFNESGRTQRSRSRSPPTFVQQQSTMRGDAYNTTKDQSMSGDQSNSTSSQNLTSSRNAEREAERQRKCLPKIRDKHLTVCSSTLWLGHVPKTVSEADISDAFGEFGTITSIDLIPPRGCAYVCMDRRQDAKRALSESKDLKLNGSHIKMAWAPGRGFKEYKKLKEFWEADTGSSFIPYSKIDESIDFDVLEEGGLIDEDSMSMEMRERRERKSKEKERSTHNVQPGLSLPLPTLPILSQPPPPTMPPFSLPPPNLSIPPPTTLGQGVIPFPPPNVTTSSSNQMPQPTNLSEFQDSNKEHDGIDGLKSPNSIDQQLSMTERQINMVEQQLSMIQQAQNMGQPPPTSIPSLHPQAIFQSQPNVVLFDMPPPPQMLHGAQQMLDPHQLAIFANPPQLLGQPHSMLPMSQAGLTDPTNMNGNPMPHYRGRF